jgi:hypothetical protein
MLGRADHAARRADAHDRLMRGADVVEAEGAAIG